jgi:hypothetical protein
MELEPGNAVQDIEEMLGVCRELLSSDLSKTAQNDAMRSFVEAITHSLPLEDQPLQQVIESLHEANKANRCLPGEHSVSLALLLCLNFRFSSTELIKDYEEAMAVFDKILVGHSPINDPNPYSSGALRTAAGLQVFRSSFYGNPEYLEEGISRCRDYLSLLPPDNLEHSYIIQYLASLEGNRFDEFGVTSGLPELQHSGNPVVADLPSLSHPANSFSELNAVHSPVMTRNDHLRHIHTLLPIGYITDKAEIEGGC